MLELAILAVIWKQQTLMTSAVHWAYLQIKKELLVLAVVLFASCVCIQQHILESVTE